MGVSPQPVNGAAPAHRDSVPPVNRENFFEGSQDMRRSASIVAALIASAGLSSMAMGASVNYPLGNLFVPDLFAPYETTLAPAGFNPTKATFSTDWVAGSGGPWSNEAIWAVTDAPLNVATEFYWDLGPSPDGASDGNPVTLNWEGYRGGYDPLPDLSADALNFIAGQAFDFSDAFWNNASLTLSDGAAATPDAFIDLGVVANQFVPFDIDTIGSDFDTELGIFNSFGGLADTDDDGAGSLLSLLNVPGLPAGDYYFNAGGFNTIYGGGGYEAIVGDFGSDGGNLVINIDGSEVYAGALGADSNQFFRFTVVPTPGTLAVVGLAGIAGIRRRR
jgi:hypothetical protein